MGGGMDWISNCLCVCYDFWLVYCIQAGKRICVPFFDEVGQYGSKKGNCVSCCMVVPMVIVMSLYGGLEACVKSGTWNQLLMIWLINIPKNFIMALPFQLIIAGPLVRRTFRDIFPAGKILAWGHAQTDRKALSEWEQKWKSRKWSNRWRTLLISGRQWPNVLLLTWLWIYLLHYISGGKIVETTHLLADFANYN